MSAVPHLLQRGEEGEALEGGDAALAAAVATGRGRVVVVVYLVVAHGDHVRKPGGQGLDQVHVAGHRGHAARREYRYKPPTTGPGEG